jgi:hypothetical protein
MQHTIIGQPYYYIFSIIFFFLTQKTPLLERCMPSVSGVLSDILFLFFSVQYVPDVFQRRFGQRQVA